MISILQFHSSRPMRRKRLRRLKAEQLENRRVLAGAGHACIPFAATDLADAPAQESVVPPFGPEIKRDSFDHKARPFKLKGDGLASEGMPLVPGLTTSFRSSGTATGLGKYTGDGTFTLGSLTIDDSTGAVNGTFQGTFNFVAANGDRLSVTFGDGSSATLTGQLSADKTSVQNVEFDAFFSPDPTNSSGYTLRLDQLDLKGETIARLETPFTRASTPPKEGESKVDYVIVQPGNSLWRIARRLSGDGFNYVYLFEANQAQIRDPDVIYPGQVFEVPPGQG